MSQQLLSHLQQCLQALEDLRERVAVLESKPSLEFGAIPDDDALEYEMTIGDGQPRTVLQPPRNKGGRPKGSKNKPKDVEA